MRKEFVVAGLLALMAVATAQAATWKWIGVVASDGTWPKWNDPANWTVDGQPNTTGEIPPAGTDLSKNVPSGSKIDLAGGSYEYYWIWEDLTLSFTNGTLKVNSNYGFTKSNTINIYAGADVTVHSPAGTISWGHQAATTTQTIYSGGKLTLTGRQKFDQSTFNVKTGGVFDFSCTEVGMCCNRGSNNLRINVADGATVKFPTGFNQTWQEWGGGYPVMTVAAGGIFELGGPFRSTTGAQGNNILLTFASGAKVRITADAPFVNLRSNAGILSGATVDVVVGEGVVEDLNPLLNLGVVTINKQGAGTLLAPTGDDTVNLQEGTVRAATAGQPLTLGEVSAGTKVEVAANNVRFAGLPAESATLAIDPSGLSAFAPVLLYPDAETAQASLAYTTAPAGTEVSSSGSQVWASSATYANHFSSTTVTDYNDATAWSNPDGVIPEGAEAVAVIAGAGVHASITEAIPQVAQIGVRDGAELTVAAAVELPKLSAAINGTLSLTGTQTLTTELEAVSSRINVAPGANITLQSPTLLQNATLANSGNLTLDGTALTAKEVAILQNNAGGTLTFKETTQTFGLVGSSFDVLNAGRVVIDSAVDYGNWSFLDGAVLAIGQSDEWVPLTATATGNLTLEVPIYKTLSTQPFAFEEGATVTKRGQGSIEMFGANAPASLDVQEGFLVWREANVAVTIPANTTLQPGAGFEIAALGVNPSQLPAGTVLRDNVSALSAVVAEGPQVIFACNSPEEAQATLAMCQFSDAFELFQDDADLSKVWVRQNIYFNGGETGEITDLNDPNGWNCGFVPTGVQGTIRGVTVDSVENIAQIFTAITLTEGAKLRVVQDVTLPAMTLDPTATLELGNGTTATTATLPQGFRGAVALDEAGDVTAISRVIVNAQSTAKIGNAAALQNLDLTVNGTLEVLEGDLWIGYAGADETTYMGLQMQGGTLQTSGSLTLFAPSAKGGCVRQIAPSLLKDAALTLTADKPISIAAISESIYNPEDVPLAFTLDNTKLDYRAESGYSYIGGATKMVFKNGARLYRADAQNSRAFLKTLHRAELVFEEGTLCYYGASKNDMGSVGNGHWLMKPTEADWPMVVVSNATFGAYHLEATGKKPMIHVYGESHYSMTRNTSGSDWNWKQPFNGAQVYLHEGANLSFSSGKSSIHLSAPLFGEGSINYMAGPSFYLKTTQTPTGRLAWNGGTSQIILQAPYSDWAGTVVGYRVVASNSVEGAYATNSYGGLLLEANADYTLQLGANGACDYLSLGAQGFQGEGPLTFMVSAEDLASCGRYVVGSVARSANTLPASIQFVDRAKNPLPGLALYLADDPTDPERQRLVLGSRGTLILIQ